VLFAVAGVLVSGRAARGDGGGELAALIAALPACDAARAHCIGIQLHIPRGPASDGAGDAPIARAEFLAVQLATANRHFASIDLGVQVVGIDSLPAAAAHIATREQRNAVAVGRLSGPVIHVFVTGQLDDVDAPNAVIRGVAWHAPNSDRKYVILSTAAPDRVLAHELGHVFGLPHSRHAISIMNKTERAEPPLAQRTFADPEIAAMRPVVNRLLRDRVIADIAR
jgi:hypothetical protein